MEGSGNGIVQIVSPTGNGLQRKNAKMTQSKSQNWLRTFRLSVKSECRLSNSPPKFTFLVINVTFWAIFEMFSLCFCSLPVSVKAFGADFLHFTILATLQSDKANMSKMVQNVTFISAKANSGCDFDNLNAFFSDKRDVLGHF